MNATNSMSAAIAASAFVTRSCVFALATLLALGAGGATALAQKLPGVALQEVVDDRYGGEGQTGGLIVVLKLEGTDGDTFPAGRSFLKAASDDSGRSLVPAKQKERPFKDLQFGSALRLDMTSPSREARSVSVSGTVELFCPSKDPAAFVKIPMGAQKLDVPVSSPALAAANLKLTLLSKKGWTAELKKQHGPESVARMRTRMKSDGRTDEEIEEAVAEAIDMRKTLADLEDEPGEGVAILTTAEDMQRIRSVKVLAGDGSEIASRGMSGSSDGVTGLRRDDLAKAPGPDATLVLTLLTEKARVSVPFDLKNVPLP